MAGDPFAGITGSTNAGQGSSGSGVHGRTVAHGPNPPANPPPGQNATQVGPASSGPGAPGPGTGGPFQGVGGTPPQSFSGGGSLIGVSGEYTPEGVRLQDGWTTFRQAFCVDLPTLAHQYDLLAHRPIGG